MYSREEVADTQDGAPSYEAGAAIGGPLVAGTLGARVAVSYRRDGGYVDDINPVTLQSTEKNANFRNTLLARVAFLWAPTDKWSVSPSIYYQDQYRNDIDNYWPIYSDPSDGKFVNADPTQRRVPDRFYLSALKIQGDVGFADFISNTSYYHRKEQSGYEGTLYNLGYYQTFIGTQTLVDANGIHLPNGALNYTSPSTVDNGQQNITQEFRLQSSDAAAKLQWTTGIFASVNRQSYLEQIHDPMLNELTEALTGMPYTDIFTDQNGNPLPYDPAYPNDSYFLKTDAKDQQYAVFGEVNYAFTDWFKLVAGVRFSKNKYSFDTLTGGPQLFNTTRAGSGDNSENATTPRLGLDFQVDPNNLYYFTYAKGFRPGGANNPLPEAACAEDFKSFGISQAPTTYSSDSVQSFEVGAKNNIGGRVRLATSIYYIKWNNIQQTVIPPICQISFIANLGQAVAKGGDVQADVAVTDNLDLELTAGYTDARYTADSRLSPTEQNPIVADGDAITGASSETGGGQPTAPVTVTAGLEYKFSAFAHQSFVRVDAEYEARAKWNTPGLDGTPTSDGSGARTLQYDTGNFVLPGTVFTSMRAGMEVGEWQISAFVDNLANLHPVVDYNNTICSSLVTTPACSQTGGERLLREYTWRPRTIGMTFIFRK
jgi:outer membrane receptor protein involved in Fe transport